MVLDHTSDDSEGPGYDDVMSYLSHIRGSGLQGNRTRQVVWKLKHRNKFCSGFCLGCSWVQQEKEWNMRGGLFLPHLKEEGEGVVSQLAEQLLLDLGVSQLLFVLQLGVNLPGHHKQVPLEGHTHHIHVRAAIPKCARQHHIHWRHIKASQHDVKYCLMIEMLDTFCFVNTGWNQAMPGCFSCWRSVCKAKLTSSLFQVITGIVSMMMT